MSPLAPSTRARDLSHKTEKAWTAARRAADRAMSRSDCWRGAAGSSELTAEERTEVGRGALAAMDEAIIRLQAARDALSAELLDAGVLAPPLVESEDLPATTWQALADEGHFEATEGELARLVVSDLAADLADAAHQLVPTQPRR
ncbi:hypothetical protein, partial [Parafrankia sp. EUN1f]